ncbi:MAG TPA: hypothetical protein VIJ46_01100, partial [Rhabdochlamydiaceae bacterium]
MAALVFGLPKQTRFRFRHVRLKKRDIRIRKGESADKDDFSKTNAEASSRNELRRVAAGYFGVFRTKIEGA